jgi:tetratricopeptide (TPR) repeat protein
MRNSFFRIQTILLLLLVTYCCSAQESKSGHVICKSEFNAQQAARKTNNRNEHIALTALQQAAEWAKADQVAIRILRDDPDNACALAVILYARRSPTVLDYKDWTADAARGLQLLESWRKPQGMSEAEYKKQYDAMAVVFYGAAGFGALSTKDYYLSRDYYLKSLSINPNNLSDNYQLGIADLEMSPLDPNGFWYIAKAIDLAQHEGNTSAVSAMTTYAEARYQKYHGGFQGWNQIVTSAATESAPPANFSVTAH